jgi:hypothetical protein
LPLSGQEFTDAQRWKNQRFLFGERRGLYPPLHEGCGENHAKRKLSPVIAWWTDGTFTDKVTGKVTKLGPSIDVGAIDTIELTDELIVPMRGLRVALQLPDELQSVDRLKFDFLDGSFVVADH